MPMDDATRFSLLAAVIIVVVAGCVIGVFACLDYFGDKGLDESRTVVSSITGSDIGSTPSQRRKRRVRIEEDASEASILLDHGSQIKTDKALMETFVKVLTQGMKLKLYTVKENKSPKDVKSKDVKLELIDSKILQWSNANKRSSILSLVSGKPKQVEITSVKTIEWGKRTSVFELLQGDESEGDRCFSLVLEDGSSLDFETSSKVERDSLAQGFTILINSLNQNQLGV